MVIAAAELFGCEDSVHPDTGEYIGKPVDDVPEAVYLTGGIYYEEAGVDEEGRGKAVLCGGFACSAGTYGLFFIQFLSQHFKSTSFLLIPFNSVGCTISDKCHQWTPSAQWEPFHSNLIDMRWAHIMVNAQNIKSSSSDQVPIVMGYAYDGHTEIYNPETKNWEPYKELVYEGWNSLECFMQYGDYIYYIGATSRSSPVYQLDLNTWEFEEIGDKPDFLGSQGNCAMAVIDDVPGILMMNGYWFNLVERTWESRRFPPFFDGALKPDTMTNFRGKATIFGSQHCDSQGVCDYTAVYQYEGSDDQWKYLGRTVHSRTLHEIIEVPKAFCDVVKTPSPSPDTAAMIIGGVGGIDEDGRRQVYQSAELFGCPGRSSFFIDDYPVRQFLSAGNYFDALDRYENEPTGTVLVCGGFVCDEYAEGQNCENTSECYEWTPMNRWSSRDGYGMDRSRAAHMMASVVDLNSGSNVPVPLAVGPGNETSIYDFTDNWQEYDPLVESGWDSRECLMQFEDTIYHIGAQIQSLDTLTWETHIIGHVPETLANHPGRCAISIINGVPGK